MRVLYCVLCLTVAQFTCDFQGCAPGFPGGGPEAPVDPSTGQPILGINPGSPPAGIPVPEFGEPVTLQVISRSSVSADVTVQFIIVDVEVRRREMRVDPFAVPQPVGPDLAAIVRVDGIYDQGRGPIPSAVYVLGTHFAADDVIEYILLDPDDECPDDPDKLSPGICGCGVPDIDTDGDGVPDCIDLCPEDPNKINPGVCGCGVPDIDSDGDGVPDCIDGCPDDPNKTEPGICGCGVPDIDSDGDGVPDCIDGCPDDPNKTSPGVCGCGVPDIDTDGDGVPDCIDGCPNDPNKTAPGVCGCGVPDTDTDGDGIPDCIDPCIKLPISDLNGDGLVDQTDVDIFLTCMTGANVGYPDGEDEFRSECPDFELVDYDCDLDVDMSDFGVFQRCLGGEEGPPDPRCLWPHDDDNDIGQGP